MDFLEIYNSDSQGMLGVVVLHQLKSYMIESTILKHAYGLKEPGHTY